MDPRGPADAIARPIMEQLSKALGQPVVLEHRPGANGMIGTAAVAKSAPDGYTLLLSHVGPMAISPSMQDSMQYDSIKDFIPITQLVSAPTILVVRPSLPIRSVKELIEYARANPGKLSYGSVGQGSTTHLAGAMFDSLAGTKMVHIPYKGASPVVTDLLGEHVDIAFIGIPAVIQHVRSGKLRALAISTKRRSETFPELAPVADTLPGFEVNSWHGLAAPVGTPQPIIDRLYQELVKIVKAPEMTNRLLQAGLEPEMSPPAEHAVRIKEDLSHWRRVVKATGVTAN